MPFGQHEFLSSDWLKKIFLNNGDTLWHLVFVGFSWKYRKTIFFLPRFGICHSLRFRRCILVNCLLKRYILARSLRLLLSYILQDLFRQGFLFNISWFVYLSTRRLELYKAQDALNLESYRRGCSFCFFLFFLSYIFYTFFKFFSLVCFFLSFKIIQNSFYYLFIQSYSFNILASISPSHFLFLSLKIIQRLFLLFFFHSYSFINFFSYFPFNNFVMIFKLIFLFLFIFLSLRPFLFIHWYSFIIFFNILAFILLLPIFPIQYFSNSFVKFSFFFFHSFLQ